MVENGAPVAILPLSVRLISTSVVTTGMVFVLGVLAPVLVDQAGFSIRWIGALTSIYFAVTVAASGMVGRLVDRSLPRSATVAHVLVAIGLLGLATGVPVVVAAAVAVGGAANAFLNPVTNRMVLWGASSSRAVLIAIKQAGTPLGGMAVGAILPALIGGLGWRAAIASLTGAVVLLAATWSGSAERGAVRGAPHEDPSAAPLGDLRGVMVAVAALGMSNGLLITFLPLHATSGLGMSLPAAGALVVTASVASLAGRVGWTFAPAERPNRLLTALCGAGAVGSVGMALLASGVALHLAVAAVGVSAMGWLGFFMRWLIRVMPAAELGSITAQIMRPYYLGLVVSPALGGAIAGSAATHRLWWLQSGLCLTAMAALGRRRTMM
jgi:MFS family permease